MSIIRTWSGDGLSTGNLTTGGSGSAGTGDDAFDGGNFTAGDITIATGGLRTPRLKYATPSARNCSHYWDISSQTAGSGRFYFTTPASWPSASFVIATLTSSSTERMRIDLGGSGSPGQVRLRNGSSQVDATATGVLLTSTTYRVEWIITHNGASGTCTARVFLGDATTASGEVSATADFGSGHNRVWFGARNSSPQVATWYGDDFAVGDSASWLGPAVVAPTVDAGDDVTADTATKVHIDADITNGSGTQAWTRVSGPTVTLSAASSVDTDVTNTGGAGVTVLRLTDGSSSDTVSITWTALPTTAGVQGIESAGDWADTSNLLDDDPDTVATVTDASSDALGLRLRNLATPSGDIAVRLRGVAETGTHTVDVSLRKHDKTTVVKSVTGVTVTDGTVEIPIDSGDITSMGTDWAHADGWGAYLVLTATAT